MKTRTSMLHLGLIALFVAVSISRSMAYDHDKTGWIDDKHQHHPFITHDSHKGYWDKDKSGAKVFIKID